MAVTLEFWKSDDRIWVEFNLKKYQLPEFLALPAAAGIITRMYDKIIAEYRNEVDFNRERPEILAAFIKKHFLEKDKKFDVVILGNGDVVQFHAEEKPDERT
jgi:hypothetical protein